MHFRHVVLLKPGAGLIFELYFCQNPGSNGIKYIIFRVKRYATIKPATQSVKKPCVRD